MGDNDLPPKHTLPNGWPRDELLVKWRLDNQDKRLDEFEREQVRIREGIADMRGRMLVFAAIISLVIGPIASTLTTWILRPPPNVQLNESVERLLKQLESERAQRGMEVKK